MTSICFYFQVHQPFRLREYNFFQIGEEHHYEYEQKNAFLLNRIAEKCYLPANRLILKLIQKYKGKFKVSFSISGCAIEQFALYRPDVLISFQKLAKTKCVEFLAETYYHSLSFLFSQKEFVRQVNKHQDKMGSLFGKKPQVFRNTELIYSNDLAKIIANLGFKGVLCEGVDRLLCGRSPSFIYKAKSVNVKCLLKNYVLSDDIAFRFSDTSWSEFPLTANKFAQWIEKIGSGTVNLFLDYETFGEHQSKATGIFTFLEQLPELILQKENIDFKTPSELLHDLPVADEYDVPEPISWADEERDLSAWLENKMQQEAIKRLYALETAVLESKDEQLIETWGRLQTSDHFYYMSTKYQNDGKVHAYFSPYDSPFDAYINFMNVLSDFEQRLAKKVALQA
jgi:alpha-amylase